MADNTNWWDNLTSILARSAVGAVVPGGMTTLTGLARGAAAAPSAWNNFYSTLEGAANEGLIGYAPGLEYGKMITGSVGAPAKTITQNQTGISPDRIERLTSQSQAPINWANDPYLKALYATLNGGGVNTSGYDQALQQNAAERKRLQQRYNTYSAQISDVFGNLSRKTLPEILLGATQSSEAIRAQEAARQGQYATQTRSAEQARLEAANAARANLGLSDAAAAGAAGDLVTQTTEAGLADKAGMDAATLQTILANEAIAKGDINRQIASLGYGQQEALSKLGMSREDALAALAQQQAQIQAQKSQAISAGQPSSAEKLAVINAAEAYKQSVLGANAGSDPASKWLASNPSQAAAAKTLLGAFLPWFYNSAPTTVKETGKTPTLDQYIQMFVQASPEGGKLITSNPPLRDFLKSYLSTK